MGSKWSQHTQPRAVPPPAAGTRCLDHTPQQQHSNTFPPQGNSLNWDPSQLLGAGCSLLPAQ